MKQKPWIEGKLRKLDFVQWDRYYSYGNGIAFFGWIEREQDEYKDFAVLILNPHFRAVEGYHCSSPKYSEEIGERLDIGHSDCQRVQDKLSIDNMIEVEQ